MLKLKLQYSGHLLLRTDLLEKTLMLGKIESRRRRGNRGWNGWMASLTQWTCCCCSCCQVASVVSDSVWPHRQAAHQVPLSLGFSRQEHWSGLPLPSPMHESEKWKWSCSVMSDCSRPHGLQPTRLLRPWDFPDKSTGAGCHCLLCNRHEFMLIPGDSEGQGSLVCFSPWGL